MKAIAIEPGRSGSVHVRDEPALRVADVPGGDGVRVRYLEVGLCGTDSDLAEGLFGVAPEGDAHLVIGHENLGQVVEVAVGAADRLDEGDLVVALVRRPGDSEFDRAGLYDLSTDPDVRERGVRRLHGFLTEEYVESADFLVPVPRATAPVAVLTEPMSGVGKALRMADEIQQRLRIWKPRRALVTGAGTIGLLAALTLRTRGVDVTCWSELSGPYRNSDLIERMGGRYVSAAERDLAETAARHGPFDIVFEATGAASVVFPAAATVATNGILVLFGLTPGVRVIEVDVGSFNQAFVLDNKALVGSVTASSDDYARAVADLGRAEADQAFRGILPEMLTPRIMGLDLGAISARLESAAGAIKAVVELGRPD